MKSGAILFFKLRVEQRYYVSVANANSNDRELNLNSNNADNSNGNNRLRLALALRAFCFFKPTADFFADGNNNFQMGAIPAGRNKLFIHGYEQWFFKEVEIGAGERKIGKVINGSQGEFVSFIQKI